MKKILSALLVMCILVTLCPVYTFAANAAPPYDPSSGAAGGAAEPAKSAGLENFVKVNTYSPGQFTDVPSTQWYAASVQTAYELGLIKGSSNTTFNPEGKITVAEVVALACRLHNIYNGGDGIFEQGQPWYQVYADYAIENIIIAAGQFSDFGVPVVRAVFAVIISKAVPAEALPAINSVTEIVDVPKDEFYSNAVYQLYNAGILTGNDQFGTFAPASSIVRSEVAAIITRIALPSERKSFSLVSYAEAATDAFLAALSYYRDALSYLRDGTEEMSDAAGYMAVGAPSSAARYAEAGRKEWVEADACLTKAIDACGNYSELALFKSYLQQMHEELNPMTATGEITANNVKEYLLSSVASSELGSLSEVCTQEAGRLTNEWPYKGK